MTAAARGRANWGRYYDQTDPALPEPERVRRAVQLREAHMAKMRLAREISRRKAAAAAAAAEQADAEARAAGVL